MNDIGRWLVSRRLYMIRTNIIAHSEKVLETVENFINFIRNWSETNEIDYALYEKIHNKELEADNLRRKILEQLSEVKIDPDIKSSLARIVRQIDWVADWALEASRLLSILSKKDVSKNIRSIMIEMAVKVNDTTKTLHKSIVSMFSDPFKTLDLADRVERLEEEVDDLYQKAREIFVNNFSKQISSIAIIVFHTLDAIEMMADKCEDTCDCIREYVVISR
ncbi:MAG: hypothetical protein DRJ34_03085 [Thermoprotei archaeon]|nr:MAG: hypothetical protein DRJ34_03085 [Thermoprotei archaeon]